MVRTIRQHEKAEALDEQDRETRQLERQPARRPPKPEDEDTLHDEPAAERPVQSVTLASAPPAGSADDLKCERVQDRGPHPCGGED